MPFVLQMNAVGGKVVHSYQQAYIDAKGLLDQAETCNVDQCAAVDEF